MRPLAEAVGGWRSGIPLGPLDGVQVTAEENVAKIVLTQSYGTAARVPVIANPPIVDRLQEAGYDSIGQLVQETRDTLGSFDIVLSPTSGVLTGPAESTMISEFTGAANFTSAFNAVGTPAASINCGFSKARKPIGLQIAADSQCDLLILQVAAWHEAHRGPEATPPWSFARLADIETHNPREHR